MKTIDSCDGGGASTAEGCGQGEWRGPHGVCHPMAINRNCPPSHHLRDPNGKSPFSVDAPVGRTRWLNTIDYIDTCDDGQRAWLSRSKGPEGRQQKAARRRPPLRLLTCSVQPLCLPDRYQGQTRLGRSHRVACRPSDGSSNLYCGGWSWLCGGDDSLRAQEQM
jgi:hypothetical protein